MVESAAFAGVRCTVEIHPFEGGRYILDGGNVLSCTVSKSIADGAPGTFSITLAPGGPDGVDSTVTWSQIATPFSLVLIGMQRGADAAIVMAGLVRWSGESQRWTSAPGRGNSSVRRLQVVSGEDFTAYFTASNYTALTMFGLAYGTAMGQALGLPLSSGFPANVSSGLLGGVQLDPSNPAQVAQAWFDRIMLGEGGLMGRSFVPYNGSRLPLPSAFARVWENYPAYVPFGTTFLAAEGTWLRKFQEMLPFPWYEFFVVTAPSGAYRETIGSAQTTDAVQSFTMRSMRTLPVSPVVVARVNPQPVLKATSAGMGQRIDLGSIDASRWNKLPRDELGSYGFRSFEVGFSADGVRNVYIINPTAYRPAYGASNGETMPFIYLFTALGDSASIHRYGYRPELATTRWLFDIDGTAAQTRAADVPTSIAEITSRLAAQYHPTPFMARGACVVPLRPSVLPGTVWRGRPFKESDPLFADWDFYVDGFRHEFTFGGESRTVLTLSRGLPAAAYADTSDGGLLQSIWLGNARREDGAYKVGLPSGTGPALEAIGNIPADIQRFLGHIGQAYVSPQLR